MSVDPGRCRSCGLMIPKMPDMTWEEWEQSWFCDARCMATVDKRCRACRKEIPEGRWFCSLACEAKMPKVAYRQLTLIENVEFLMRWRVPVDDIPDRVDVPSKAALARTLARLGRHDLAAPFNRVPASRWFVDEVA